MPAAFIFHGTGGHPQENWFPWLKEKLEARGYEVFVPQFPTPENQTLENWFEVLEDCGGKLAPDTILVGHSLGGAFLLRVLEKYGAKAKAAFLVATPIGILPIKNYAGDRPFISEPFDWEKIRRSCREFFVFHSNDDPYVSLGNGEELARKLGTELVFVPNAGHFNKASGYAKFEFLLEKIDSA